MCGIAYKHNLDGTPVNEAIFDQFASQYDRGNQGFGLYDGQEMNLIRTANEDKIINWLAKYDSNLIMFHHRFPTSTINTAKTAHPLTTGKYFGNKQYILVHNGIMHNDFELLDNHKKLGIKYKTLLKDGTFNDSEALLWDLALTLDGRQKKLQSLGNMAFILLEIEDKVLTKMHFGRNSRPLNLYRDKQTIELSSEGRGELIKSNTLYTYNYKAKRLTNKPMFYAEYQYTNSVNTTNSPYFNNYTYPQSYQSYPDAVYDDSIDKDYTYDDDNDYEYASKYNAANQKLEDMVLDYLNCANGDFETAYWLVEGDYNLLSEQDEDNTAELFLLEDVMERIENDPENKGANSVSSMFTC